MPTEHFNELVPLRQMCEVGPSNILVGSAVVWSHRFDQQEASTRRPPTFRYGFKLQLREALTNVVLML